MGETADTHIKVTDTNWSRLNRMKRPGDSFNDVVDKVLDRHDQIDDETWERLHDAKPPDVSLDEFLRELLDAHTGPTSES